MANYRIFVPARKGSEMPDITINVEASNWLVALKESLKKIGEQGDSLSNILCETGEDGSMRVADPATKRVFIIKEVEAATEAAEDLLMKEAEERAKRSREEAERAEAARLEAAKRVEELKLQEQAAKAAEEAETSLRTQQREAAEADLVSARAEATALANQAAEDATGTIGNIRIEEVQRAVRDKKKAERKVSGAAGDEWDDLDDWYDDEEAAGNLENTLDGVLSDVFMATEDLYTQEPNEASGSVLDQAMKHVSAEAGSVFLIELNTALQDLNIAAARGPIGKDIQGIKLPRGKGIVGFSALKGIKLTVNNVQRNPNFYGKLDQQFGFKTQSLLCIPVSHEERLFGVIEMVNKTGDGEWTGDDRKVIESLAAHLGKVLSYKASMVSLNI